MKDSSDGDSDLIDPQPSENNIVGFEYPTKVLVVGEVKVGKTSILRRYTKDIFTNDNKATIGVDFGVKVIQRDPHTTVRLQLWDIAGQERFTQMTHVYYRDASAAVVVFDITKEPTFEAVKRWKEDIDKKVKLPNEKPIPVILLANKIDLMKEGIPKERQEEFDKYCQENGFIGWKATSAKDNIGINDAFNLLVDHILKNVSELPKQVKKKTVILDDEEQNKEENSCRC